MPHLVTEGLIVHYDFPLLEQDTQSRTEEPLLVMDETPDFIAMTANEDNTPSEENEFQKQAREVSEGDKAREWVKEKYTDATEDPEDIDAQGANQMKKPWLKRGKRSMSLLSSESFVARAYQNARAIGAIGLRTAIV